MRYFVIFLMWSLTGSNQRNTYALSDQKYSHGHLNAAGESKTSLGSFLTWLKWHTFEL